MKTICKTVFQFNELNETAKQKAIENCREFNVSDEFWYECVYEDAKEIAKLLGIDISRIYFRGFWSQGDGACFEGYFQYNKQGAKKAKEYAPQDKELHRIADEYSAIQKACFYSVYGSVKQRGRYMHENCTEIDMENAKNKEEDMEEVLRDFMRWIYSNLEAQYEYLTSDEAVSEMIEANGYDFDEDGNLA